MSAASMAGVAGGGGVVPGAGCACGSHVTNGCLRGDEKGEEAEVDGTDWGQRGET